MSRKEYWIREISSLVALLFTGLTTCIVSISALTHIIRISEKYSDFTQIFMVLSVGISIILMTKGADDLINKIKGCK